MRASRVLPVGTVWVLCGCCVGAEWVLSGCCQGLSETHKAPAAKHIRHTSQVNKKAFVVGRQYENVWDLNQKMISNALQDQRKCALWPRPHTQQCPLSAHSVATQWPHSGHCKYVGCLKESKHMLSRFKLLNARVPRFHSVHCVGTEWALSGH